MVYRMLRAVVALVVSLNVLNAHEHQHSYHKDQGVETVLSQTTDLHSEHTRASAVKATKRAAIEQLVRPA